MVTLGEGIAIATSIAAALSATAALFAVREAQKSREHSYRPDLALSSIAFREGAFEGGVPRVQGFWTTDDNRPSDGPLGPGARVRVQNVGLGSAKDVRLTWSADLPELTREVASAIEKAGLPWSIQYEDGCLQWELEPNTGGASFWEAQQHGKADYILPAAKAVEPTEIPFPSVFSVLFTTLVRARIHGTVEERMSAPPSIDLKLEFEDVGGAAHVQRYQITPKVVALAADGSFLSGFLECESSV